MSKASPMLRCESHSSNASLNMVTSSMHEYISCDSKPIIIETTFQEDLDKNSLTLPTDFDHMYASNMDDLKGRNENQRQDDDQDVPGIESMRDILILHLDLIQCQSEQLVKKDKELAALKQENENLKLRLERMDRRVVLQKREVSENISPQASSHSPLNSVIPSCHSPLSLSIPVMRSKDSSLPTSPGATLLECLSSNSKSYLLPSPSLSLDNNKIDLLAIPSTTNDLNSDSRSVGSCSTRGSTSTCKRRRTDRLPGTQLDIVEHGFSLRKRQRSSSSLSSNSTVDMIGKTSKMETGNSAKEGRNTRTAVRNQKTSVQAQCSNNRRGVKGRSRGKGLQEPQGKKDVLTTDIHYYTGVGGYEEEEITAQNCPELEVEVPCWRTKVFSSCYSMEATENLGDDVFNKRHHKQELDEKRRKRWDIQRIREQRQYERLRQRYSGSMEPNSKGGNEKGGNVLSLWPNLEELKDLEVMDVIPVTAFGHELPSIDKSVFSVPWISPEANTTVKNCRTSYRR